jgi:hypothetical protein
MRVPRIHRGKQPRRPHFIREWAEKCGFEDQVDLVEALEADKSVVSRWYAGASPGEEWQHKLAALFGHEGEPEIIFRHPDDDWLGRWLRGRSEDEISRAKQLLETAFPSKSSRNQ